MEHRFVIQCACTTRKYGNGNIEGGWFDIVGYDDETTARAAFDGIASYVQGEEDCRTTRLIRNTKDGNQIVEIEAYRELDEDDLADLVDPGPPSFDVDERQSALSI